MDPLAHYLGGPRARSAFALLMEMGGSWGVDVRDGAALTVIAVVHGAARLEGTLLAAGDVALVRGPEPYVVSDAAGHPPTIAIQPGQRCESLDGRDLRTELRHGLRRWGTSADPETTLLVGTYDRADDVGGLVVSAVPRVAVVPRERADGAVVDLLARELAGAGPAGQVVVDRLLDVLVVSTVRGWFADPGAPVDRTWLACDDPVVVRALEHLHAEPAAPWTVESLARRVNLSRASLAARFRAGVGQSPMAYLARWRLTLAGDLLLDPSVTVAAVARSVGYENAYAFSTAFKRQVGTTPSEFRRRSPVLAA